MTNVDDDQRNDATRLLKTHSPGEPAAADRLMPLIYDNLRKLASRYLQAEAPGQTLQPTALVHEAYVRLIDITRVDWQGKSHFFAMAARQMRRLLVEKARAKMRHKRSGQKVTLNEELGVSPDGLLEVIDVDRALTKLSGLNDRQSQVAELRFFAGMTVEETAHALGVSERTVKEDWRLARAWLMRELERSSDESA